MPEFGPIMMIFIPCSFLFLYLFSFSKSIEFWHKQCIAINSDFTSLYMDAAAAVRRLRDAARELKVFRHPETGRLWLLVQGAQGQETHSLCPEAVNLAQLVLDWMKDQPIPRSLAATTDAAPHRLLGWPGVRHSPLDPEGLEWEEYQEIGMSLIHI